MTRHNIGFLVVEAFAKKYGWSLKRDNRFLGAIAKGKVREVEVHLLMPMIYMNNSGQSVSKYCSYFKVPIDQLIVINDDVSFDFRRMRLRERGSSGGHNGLKSIESHLGSSNYARLRLGVGASDGQDLSEYVLGRFSKDEQKLLVPFIERAVTVVDCWLDKKLADVMSLANTFKPSLRQEK